MAKTIIHFIISYLAVILFLSALTGWILGIAFEKRYSDPQKALQAILAEKGVSNYEKYLLTFKGKKTDPTFKYSFQECRLSMRNKPRVEIPILDPSFRCPLLPNNLLIATWTPGPNSIRYTQNITNFNIFNISWVISSMALE